jgi:hypothetical protein
MPAPPASPPPLPPPPAAVQPLTPEHLRVLQLAQAEARPIRRAFSVARFDGWTIALFGGLTALLGLPVVSNVLIGLALLAIGSIELRAADRLRRLDARALRVLAINQLVLAVLLITYSVWRLLAIQRGGAAEALGASGDPELSRMLGSVDDITKSIARAVYVTLIAVAVFAQGGLALYYLRRRKILAAYLSQTPPWILEMQRAGVL